MTRNSAELAEIIEPSYTLQRKMGGSAAKLLTPAKVKKAEAAVEELVPPLRFEVERLLGEIEALTKNCKFGCSPKIWALAHEIRGLAGSANYIQLGKVCDLLCLYIEEKDETFIPNETMISTINVTANYTMNDGADSDPVVSILIEDCRKAIVAQRRREKRASIENL